MSRNGKKGGARDMFTTEIKPIRPTNIEFENDEELQKFLNYASSTQKTNSKDLERVRDLIKNHRPASERK